MEIKKDKFIKAAKEKNYTYIDEYLKAKGNINYTTALGTSALMWAVRNNDIELVNTLIDAGINVNLIDSLGNTALIYCCKQGYKPSIFNKLLQAGANVNIKNAKGESALDYAYQSGNKEFVDLLLAKGAAKPTGTFNSLIQAIFNGEIKIVTKLLKEIDNINKCFDNTKKYWQNKPKTLLTLAVQNKHIQIAEELLKAGAKILVPDEDNFANYPVISGKEFGWLFSNCPTAKEYLKKHAKKEHTLMELAVQSGDKNIVEFIKKCGGVITSDELNTAVSQGNKGLVNSLLNVGARTKGRSLEAACRRNDVELVKLLIDAGAEIDFRNKWGDPMDTTLDWGPTPLMIACQRGNINIVKLLLEAGAKINISPRKLSPSNPHERSYYCDSPLMAAVRYNYLPIVELLLDAGADVNYKNEDGETALTVAEKNDNPYIIKMLKNAEKKEILIGPLIHFKNKLSEESKKILKELEQLKNINSQNRKGETRLTLAAAKGDFTSVKLLLLAKANINATNKWGRTPLILAAQNGHTEIVKFLIEAGADVNFSNRFGDTALTKATIDRIISFGDYEKTEYDIRKEANYTEVVKLLLEYGAFVDAQNDMGETALMGAYYYPEVVKLLLSAGANIEARTKSGTTALMKYVSAGPKASEAVKILLEAGANVHAVDNEGQTMLIYAIYEGEDYVENIKLLLAAGADVNAKNKYKDTALIWAAVRGSYKIAKTLLEANADVNAKNNNGETALSMIRKHVNGHENYAKMFYLLKSATEKGAK